MAFEVQEEGYLAKILVGDGAQEVPINQLLAIMVEEQEDIAKYKDYDPNTTAPKQADS